MTETNNEYPGKRPQFISSAQSNNPYSLYLRPAHASEDALRDGSERKTEYVDLTVKPSEERALKLHLQGQFHEALSLYKDLIRGGSENALVYANAALLSRRYGNNSEAISLLYRSLELDPDSPEVHYNLGNALSDEGDLVAAIEAYNRALSQRLDFPEALFNLGNAYRAHGDIEMAISCYNKALCLRPEFPDALFNLGNSLKQQGLLKAAIHAYRRGLAHQPGNPETLFNLGLAYYDAGDYHNAIAAYQQALTLRPVFPEALYKLGNAQREAGEVTAAIHTYHKAISLNPDVAEAYFNLGIFYRDLGDLGQAIASFRQAIRQNENYGEAQRNYALGLLLVGRFHEGWSHYEWRREEQQCSAFYSCADYWDPVRHGRHRVLVVGEQGVGDQVMFASILRDVQPFTSELTVQIDKRLLPIFERSMPAIRFVDTSHPDPAALADMCIPIGSLGLHFRQSLEDFEKARAAYLVANRRLSEELRTAIRQKGELLCGIAWNSMRTDTGPSKSMALEALASALAREGVRLISLQYGDVEKEIELLRRRKNIDVTSVTSIDNFYDLEGLSALIDACDLVISTSNTAAHLAGALGKPTWLLVQKVPDWRWGLEGEQSLWYPTMTILRQTKSGEWSDVLDRASAALDAFLRTSGSGKAAS